MAPSEEGSSINHMKKIIQPKRRFKPVATPAQDKESRGTSTGALRTQKSFGQLISDAERIEQNFLRLNKESPSL